MKTIKLRKIVHIRPGDKGGFMNMEKDYPIIYKQITLE